MMMGTEVRVRATGRKGEIVGIERDFYLIKFRSGQELRYKGWAVSPTN